MDEFIDFWRNKADRVRIYIEHSLDGKPGSIQETLPNFQDRQACQKPFTDMIIYWDGHVGSCNHDWTRLQVESLGNVNNDNICAIWQGDRYAQLRELHNVSRLDGVHPCNYCDHWKMYYLPAGFLGRLFVKGEEVRA
ncbi:MAG: SPASM domain-containing protein [Magnetococcales bacterium]|nr:SPASM domain-containing protein [Magnetococcales bacterium]